MAEERAAVGVVVVSHGQLATELLNAAEMIVGDLPKFAAVSIGWHDNVDVARTAIEQAIARVDGGRGVLLLTDMFGGTPSNLGMSFLAEGKVEVVTGVNLPMLDGSRARIQPRTSRRWLPSRASTAGWRFGWRPRCSGESPARSRSMVSRELPVVNVLLGLHARAAARFVRTAGAFASNVTVAKAAHKVDGKSILGLLFLSAARGSGLPITADGTDEIAALAALASLVEHGFEDA